MPVSPLADNPFAVLTAIVAPAILTNASSVLALGTSNRIARVVDRSRVVAGELGQLKRGDAEYKIRTTQMERLQLRAQLLLRALRVFYLSLGSFAASALISVIGSTLAYFDLRLGFQTLAIMGLVIGTVAVAGLVGGCALIVEETRLALKNIAEEAQIARSRYESRHEPPAYGD